MMKRVQLEAAYVLHRRPYREHSFIVELFTYEHGRQSVIAKGVRQPRSGSQGLLQPFTPLLVSFCGKNELMTLTSVELNGDVIQLRGDCLFAGFYLNELLLYLLQKWDPHPVLFEIYKKTIMQLQSDRLEQKTLRSFEKALLEELGFGLLAKSDISLQNSIHADKYYRFVPEHGFLESKLGSQVEANVAIFSGKSLLAIANETWDEEFFLQDAKRLMRLMLTPLLGARAIHSRKLFMPLQEESES